MDGQTEGAKMKGCGAKQATGHGEIAICGAMFYSELWLCRSCIKTQRDELAAALEYYTTAPDGELARKTIERIFG